MLVFAQRGHHAVFPGNTLQAFDAAVRLGVDGIQTDVRLSGDGVAVLFSDEHVRGRPVADLSRHDIARIVGHEVPTLNEALLRFPKPVWNIEIKAPAAIGVVLQAVSAFAATRRMVVTSVHHELVARCARRWGVVHEWDDVCTIREIGRNTGIPVANLLRHRAAELRRAARFDVRGHIEELPGKLLVPLGLCLFPAFITLTVIPAVASMAQGFFRSSG